MAKTIADYKKDYEEARKRGDAAGMQAANNGANAIRQQQGQAIQSASQDIANTASKNNASTSNRVTSSGSSGSSIRYNDDDDDGGYSGTPSGSYDPTKPQGAQMSGVAYDDVPDRPLDDYYYAKESYYKQMYETARASGDVEGMRAANDGMNQVRNDYGLAAQSANGDISFIKGQTGYYGGGSQGGGSYGNSAYGTGGISSSGQIQIDNLYSDLWNQYQQMYDELLQQQQAAQQAAVDQAVNDLNGQKTGLDQSYADLYRQLYLDRRRAEKNLPQQMAAMGISGGLTESTALGLQTDYTNALRQGEQQRLSSLSDIDQAIANARLTGDIGMAQTAAQTAMDKLNSYGNVVSAMQNQQNWQNQFAYQQQQDAIANQQWQQTFNRQQMLDELSRDDLSYDRKLSLAQYLYENTGDASGFSALGFTPDQVAALQNSYGAFSAAPTLTYTQVMDAIDSGMLTPNVLSAYEYYMGAPYAATGLYSAAVPTAYTADQPAAGNPVVSYNNGSLTTDQVRQLQTALGVTADGFWGPASRAAVGGLSADAAWAQMQSDPIIQRIQSLNSMRAQTGSERGIPNSIVALGSNGIIPMEQAERLFRYFGYDPSDYIDYS